SVFSLHRFGFAFFEALFYLPDIIPPKIALQRHFRVLTQFAHVESWLSRHKRQREVVFYAPVNLCDKRACSASVAVGIEAFTRYPSAYRGVYNRQAGLQAIVNLSITS